MLEAEPAHPGQKASSRFSLSSGAQPAVHNAARFGGTLALLAGADVPTLKAPQAAAETLGNRALRADAAAIMEPLLIVGMGLIVVAVLMPIIQLNTWVK